jgi:predicted secreted protein
VANAIKAAVAMTLLAGLAIAQPAAAQSPAASDATAAAQSIVLVADASAILTTARADIGAARTSAARATGLVQAGAQDDAEPGFWVILLAGAFLIGSVAQRRASAVR